MYLSDIGDTEIIKRDKFRFRKDIGINWFINKTVEEWNKLSKHVCGKCKDSRYF